MDEKKRETSRIVFWDNLKFSLILLVVVGHFAEQYINQVCLRAYLFLYIHFICRYLYIYQECFIKMKK